MQPKIEQIVALAGRRIDPPDSLPRRFPIENISTVQLRIRNRLKSLGATALVSSAACGADLIALQEADAAGIRFRIVLPIDPHIFRSLSVMDRPGDWGPSFDRLVNKAARLGDLIVLKTEIDRDQGYTAANQVILDEAERLVYSTPNKHTVTALIVWEGIRKASGDLTFDFAEEARARGIPIEEILTL